ncbi:MAG: TonB-dependent receptor, partial [Proteobacteria bacterium]|nr:TonB-dependent receptor [Pseudomonadota bacterium]
MLRKNKLQILTVGILLIGLVQVGLAEETVPTYKLGEIVVTATKSEKTLMDAPGSVSVVKKDEIEKRNVKDVDEAIRMVTGVYDRKRKGFADTMPSINIRGIYGTDRNLILIDGQPVSEHVWRRFPLELVERIEVVKGPFSSLYGEGAMGGVVNVITKKPKEKLELKLNTGIETFNSRNYEMLCSGKLKGWFYSASARKRQTDGYPSVLTVKSATTQTTKPTAGTEVTGWEETTDKKGSERFLIGDAGDNYYNDISYNTKLGYEFSSVSRVQLDFTRTDYEYGYKNGKSYLLDTITGNVVNKGDVFFYDSEEKKWKVVKNISETDFESSYGGNVIDLLNFSGETKISDISLKSYLSYDKNDYWWVQPSLTAAYIQPSWGEKTRGELLASKPLPLEQILTVGIELRESKDEGEYYNLTDWKDKNTRTDLTQERRGKTSILGLYLQDEIGLFEPFTIYLGGRYDKWQASEGYNFIIKNGSTTTWTFDKRDIDCFSPRISLVYKVSEDTRARFSIGRAFRGPTSYDMYRGWEYISAGKRMATLSNPDLNPEKITSGEVGIEQVFAEKTSIKVAYFHNRMNDYIYTKTFTEDEVKEYGQLHYGTTSYYSEISQKQNIAEAKSEGLELDIRTKLSKN